MKKLTTILLLTFICCIINAQEEITKIIKKHGLEQSKVMETASWITDVYGPRLTGSPMLDKATEWAQSELKKWGMTNVHLDEWGPFGRGWQLDHFEMHANTPGYWSVIAYPKAWSPTVKGTGDVIFLNIKEEGDIAKYRGKLKGKFVLMDTIRNVDPPFKGFARRYDAEGLFDLATAGKPTPRPRRNLRAGGFNLNKAIWKMLEEENPIAVLDRSYKGDLGTVFVSGARSGEGGVRDKDKKVVPQVTLSVEHYNRIFRLMNKGIPVKLSLDLQAQYTNPDEMEHNIIAEIPGTDLKEEVVIFGAHFDSWHTGTGATDNGAGSAVMMEAARILLETINESGVQPRRTLRLALWTGEEQGLYGSRKYVDEFYADFGESGFTPQEEPKPAAEKVSAYYNLDNGTGKIRGVYLQGNQKLNPIFRDWLEPFEELEAKTLTLRNTGGTDHLPFDAVGIPAFQFIQDPMAYFARTHHSNMDNLDHLVEDDLKRSATIVASFVWNTSQRDELLPRKPKMEEVMAENREKKKRKKPTKILDLSGNWKYAINAGGMISEGHIMIKKNGKGYDIEISSEQSDEKSMVKGVENKKNNLTFSYTIKMQGVEIPMNMNLDFYSDELDGMVKAGTFGTFPITGDKE